MPASLDQPGPGLGPVAAPPAPASPVLAPTSIATHPRRASRWLLAVLVGLGVLVVAASVGFGVTARRAADREHDTAVQWRDRSERQDEVIADLDRQRTEAVADAAEAAAENTRLRVELEASRAESAQLRQAYQDLSARLAAAEELVAERAGLAAMSRDRAALGG